MQTAQWSGTPPAQGEQGELGPYRSPTEPRQASRMRPTQQTGTPNQPPPLANRARLLAAILHITHEPDLARSLDIHPRGPARHRPELAEAWHTLSPRSQLYNPRPPTLPTPFCRLTRTNNPPEKPYRFIHRTR